MNEDFESYRIDEEEEEIQEIETKRYTMWNIVPRIMAMPASGWEMAKKHGPAPELATLRFLLPLCLLSGASVFFGLLYPGSRNIFSEEAGFTVMLVNAVIQFCSFFIGYYVALLLEKAFLPRNAKELPSTSYGKLLTMTGVATLALFHIIFEALPMLDFVLVFLPLWTIFLLYKGIDHPSVSHSDKRLLDVGIVCIVTIVSPTLVEWILALFA